MSQLKEIHRSSIKISDQDQDQIQPIHQYKKQRHFSQLHCKTVYSIVIIAFFIFLYLFFKSQTCEKDQKVVVNNNSRLITILKKYQHDLKCYTQGLSFINDTHILESCGLYKASYMQILQYNTPKYPNTITRIVKSDYSQTAFFAQGSVLFPKNGLIYMLTWREHRVYRFQMKQGLLKQKDSFEWIYQGWGLTHDNQNLIISDGSPNLFITDADLNIIKTINIRDAQGNPIKYLNQLQYVQRPDGSKFIYANIYLTTKIVKINYLTQKVEDIYDLKDLVEQQIKIKSDEVLNGIAFDRKSQTFLLTGKKWQYFYLVKGI